jgi:hypothetical protein
MAPEVPSLAPERSEAMVRKLPRNCLKEKVAALAD